MKWNDAIKLHNEDEVTVKETGAVMNVITTEVNRTAKSMRVMLTDGNWYDHRDIR